MEKLEEKYDLRTAAAWILGHARKTGEPVLPEAALLKTTDECSDEELMQIVSAGQKAGLKLYPFKQGIQVLARTRKTLGFLHSVAFDTMLDVGSGRGVFLIPFIKEFPWVQVTGLDLLERRVTFLNELADGGFSQLKAESLINCQWSYNICHFPCLRAIHTAAFQLFYYGTLSNLPLPSVNQ